MKKVLTLVGTALLCFIVGTFGIYFAMPSLDPDKVNTARDRLDSLGLLGREATEVEALYPDSVLVDSTDTTSLAQIMPTPHDRIQKLRDSLNVYVGLVADLSADTTELVAVIARLSTQLDELTAKDHDATELSKSLAKLDAKQLGNILAGLDLETIERLYEKATARERTRLLQSMSPEQAARFVRTIVKGPEPDPPPEAAASEQDPVNAADEPEPIQ